MNKSNIPVVDMERIFCDYKSIPRGRVANYYMLLSDIFNKKELRENAFVYLELKKCIDEFDERLRNFLALRYGLNDSVIRNLDEIDHSITTERVRQLLNKALFELKKQKTRYNIYYRIELLKIRKELIDKELDYYGKIASGDVTIHLTLKDFNFSTRTVNALGRAKITTYEQLMDMTLEDLLSIRNLGVESVNEIWLELHGEEIYQYIKGGK